MRRHINNIVIIGGGTAGWTTALNFLLKTNCNITVVCAEELKIIGVGESTTGQFNDIIKSAFDENDFLKKTGSTIKLGIYHQDWNEIGKSFTSPLGDSFFNETKIPNINYDYFRIFHIAEKLKFDSLLQSQLMINNKLPIIENTKQKIQFNHTAYHLDTFKVGQYIKDYVIKNNRVTYVNDKITKANKNEFGFIESLNTQTGKIINGDLFVDCSGFLRILIEKEFDNKFISYKDNLLINRALPFHIKNEDNTIINNYTKVSAKKYGWLWDIPLQHRKGMGYVYCDDFITPDKAQEEIEKELGVKIIPQNDIKFKSGRLEKFWIKNVLSTGLASAFIEPLEATSIHCTMVQINHFLENYFSPTMELNSNINQNLYNKQMIGMWEHIKDFIILHYNSKRNDTEFWIEQSSSKRHTESLKSKLDIWKYRMPRNNDYSSADSNNLYYLGNTLWLQILAGMDLLDSKIAKEELMYFNLYNIGLKKYEAQLKENKWYIDNCIDNNKFYLEL